MLLNSFYLYLKKFVIIIFLSISFQNFAQEIAILKYNGGGDWYANPTALPNLIGFSNKHINTLISENPTSIPLSIETNITPARRTKHMRSIVNIFIFSFSYLLEMELFSFPFQDLFCFSYLQKI